MPEDLIGRRVRLVRCNDPYTALAPGSEGTVTFVDSLGTVHVNWDDGARLGLVEEDGDRFELIGDAS
jgi:hypothetical protein